MKSIGSMDRAALCLALAATACGSNGYSRPAAEVRRLGPPSTLDDANGLSLNGLTVNGITTNGITTNGITTNGITTNGLTTNGLSSLGFTQFGLAHPAFATWFSTTDSSYADMVMRYLARCALPSGTSRSYTYQGTTYTWNGVLGLAPGWASGRPISVAEQQLVSACLAAHANKFGVHVPFSIRGEMASGALIPVGDTEDADYPVEEGCFFGNLFDGSGVFSGTDSTWNDASVYSGPRACAAATTSTSVCAPMVSTGLSCSSICTRSAGSPTTYSSCTYNGVRYRPVNTRIRSSDVYVCGDGICQFTETCQDSLSGKGCGYDCGSCSGIAVAPL